MKHFLTFSKWTLLELPGFMKSGSVVMKSPPFLSQCRKRNFFIAMLAVLLGSYSCMKDSPNNPQHGALDIYVAGNVLGGSGTYGNPSIAAYWKNGNYVPLTDGTKYANASSIVVSGNDVYVAGDIEGRAVSWKNGILQYLTNGSINSRANSIVVSGNDVYVAGFEGYIAKYW